MSDSEIEVIPSIKRRVLRLLPVYYLLLIGTVLVVTILKRTVPIGDLVIHSLFSQNINWMITGYKSALVRFTAHTWTLSIEMYLFVLWLMAFKLLKTVRLRLHFNAAGIVCAVAWRTITALTVGDPMITSLCPIAHMDAFAIGSFMAMYEKEKIQKANLVCWMTGLCGLGIIVASVGITAYCNGVSLGEAYSLYKSSDNYLKSALTCNIYLGLSLVTVGVVEFSKSFRVRWKLSHLLVSLGDISYSAYLIHYPVNVVLRTICKNAWIVFLLTICVTVVCAVIVEKIVCIYKNRQSSKLIKI